MCLQSHDTLEGRRPPPPVVTDTCLYNPDTYIHIFTLPSLHAAFLYVFFVVAVLLVLLHLRVALCCHAEGAIRTERENGSIQASSASTFDCAAATSQGSRCEIALLLLLLLCCCTLAVLARQLDVAVGLILPTNHVQLIRLLSFFFVCRSTSTSDVFHIDSYVRSAVASRVTTSSLSRPVNRVSITYAFAQRFLPTGGLGRCSTR